MKKIFTLLIIGLMTIPLFSQIEKKVIIEHFTNTRCGICASRNPVFYQTLENYPNVLHIAYHPSSPYSTCVFNQHNKDDNDNRAYFYNIYGGTPRAVIQGDVLPVASKLVTADQIESYLYQTSDYSVTLTNEPVRTDAYKVTFTINRAVGAEMQVVQVMIGIAEKEIEYAAPNGEDLHYDVFRDKIYHDTASVNLGDTETITVEYDVHPDWDLNQFYAYVVVQDQYTQEILQSSTSLESPSFIPNRNVTELNDVFYPNPSNGVLKIKSAYLDEIKMVELFSITGNKVKSFHEFSSMSIADLPQGIYFSKITNLSNESYTTKIIKSGN